MTNTLPADLRRKTAHVNLIHGSPAFTLIELLVVISIIAVLAAFIIPAIGQMTRLKYINTAKAEMAQLETAIADYKSDHNFYPPDNGPDGRTNQLYYELEGTTLTNISGTLTYLTLDRAASIAANDVKTAFPQVSGFANCNKAGASEDALSAKNYIHELRPHQTESAIFNTIPVTIFTTAVGGPDTGYNPLNQSAMPYLNPWRYVSSNPQHNHGGYDLWVQLKIRGKTNLICNWNTKVTINDNSVM